MNKLSADGRQGLPGSGEVNEFTWLHLVTDEGIDGFSRIMRGPISLDPQSEALAAAARTRTAAAPPVSARAAPDAGLAGHGTDHDRRH